MGAERVAYPKTSPTPGMRATAYATARGLAYGGPSCFYLEIGLPVKFVSAPARFAAWVLLVALVAALGVAGFRYNLERHSRHVELAMDFNDIVQLAQAQDYPLDAFLVELRKAGLTSLALTEELGSDISGSTHASVISGTQLLASSRLSPVTDLTLAALLRAGKVNADTVYLTAYDAPTYARYREMLPLHFAPSSISLLHKTKPWIFALRTQIDYFNGTPLGIPADEIALARRLHFEIVPRFQNDEQYDARQIAALATMLGGDRRISTVIFFGLRPEVVGYPDNIKATAELFKAHKWNFGAIEIYDPSQLQKGSDELAKLIPEQTVRVQAIAKPELDKMKFGAIAARFELGVRERNIRVAYLRPYLHEQNGKSLEMTNAELVNDLASRLRDDGFTLGRASPITAVPAKAANGVLAGIAALGVPSIFVILLGFFGWYRRTYAVAAYAATVLFYAAGVATHHDMLARSVLALLAALLFAAAAFVVLVRPFNEEPATGTRAQLLRSIGWTLLVTGIALLGALLVVGLMSTPLAMQEIERVRGVKLILVLPPLIALAIYVFSRRFGAQTENAGEVFLTPVRAYHILILGVVAVAGALLVMRSGNTSDIAPSSFELSIRHGLTALLAVRPRFKEFIVGIPTLMLATALLGAHRKAVGWLLALGIGVGIGDVIDTFSHLHTPLAISALRIVNDLVLGVIIGIVLILIYRAFVRAFSRSSRAA